MNLFTNIRNAWDSLRGVEASASVPEEALVPLGRGAAWLNYLNSGNVGKITPAQAVGVSTVFACISYRAMALANCPVEAFKWKDGRRDLIQSGKLYKLMRYPNDEINRVQFWMAMEYNHALYNRAFAQIIRSETTNEAIGLEPLENGRVEVHQDPRTRALKYVIDGTQWLDRDEILDIKGLSYDGYNALAFNSYAQDVISLARDLDKNAHHTFSEKAGRFSNLLLTDEKMTEDAYKKYAAWLLKPRSGGRIPPGILDGGLKPYESKKNNVELEFGKSRKEQQIAICQIFRVPPHKVGIIESSNRSDGEVQQIQAVTDTIGPIASNYEAEMEQFLLTYTQKINGTRIEFKLEELMRATFKERAEYARLMIESGGTVNEARNVHRLNPIKGGDKPLVQVNLMTLDHAHIREQNEKNLNQQSLEPQTEPTE